MSTNQSNMSQTASNSAHAFDSFLHAQSEQVWADALRQLLPRVHEVDRNATQIWFHFFPLSLARALERADRPRPTRPRDATSRALPLARPNRRFAPFPLRSSLLADGESRRD